MMCNYYELNQEHVDPRRLKAEREKARKLKKSNGWQKLIQAGKCHYCGEQFKQDALTMDHVVPLARGGSSVLSNVVPACKACNSGKKLETPLDQIFAELAKQRANSE